MRHESNLPPDRQDVPMAQAMDSRPKPMRSPDANETMESYGETTWYVLTMP